MIGALFRHQNFPPKLKKDKRVFMQQALCATAQQLPLDHTQNSCQPESPAFRFLLKTFDNTACLQFAQVPYRVFGRVLVQ